jgi:hypothetical protein
MVKPNTMKQIHYLILVYSLLLTVNSCYLVEAIRPIPDPDIVVPIDTTVIDTIIPIDTLPLVIDTPCTDPQEVVTPQFVTLYIEFDIFEPVILWQGGQVESNNLADVVAAVTDKPFTIYNEGRSWSVMIDSTNDNQYFYLKIFARSNGAKIYMGSIMQGFIFAGALTAPEFLAVAIKYQSVDRFNFRNCLYPEADLIAISYAILGECKLGRTWSDFRWWNPGTVPDSIPLAFNDADWNTVLHSQEIDCKQYLTEGRYTQHDLVRIASTGCQIVIRA